MSDSEVPLHEYLKEVVGYLNILGKNLQKRTSHLTENKISEKYLSTPENVKKTSEKINSICSLSKASIVNVQKSVQNAVDSYLRKFSSNTHSKSSHSSKDIKSGAVTQHTSDATKGKSNSPNKSDSLNKSVVAKSHSSEKSVVKSHSSEKSIRSHSSEKSVKSHSSEKSVKSHSSEKPVKSNSPEKPAKSDSSEKPVNPHSSETSVYKSDSTDKSISKSDSIDRPFSKSNSSHKKIESNAQCKETHKCDVPTTSQSTSGKEPSTTRVKSEDISTSCKQDPKKNFIQFTHKGKTIFLPKEIDIEAYLKCSINIIPFPESFFEKYKIVNSEKLCSGVDFTKHDFSQNRSKTKFKPHSKPKESPDPHKDDEPISCDKTAKEDIKMGDKCIKDLPLLNSAKNYSRSEETQFKNSKITKFKRICFQDSSESDEDNFSIRSSKNKTTCKLSSSHSSIRNEISTENNNRRAPSDKTNSDDIRDQSIENPLTPYAINANSQLPDTSERSKEDTGTEGEDSIRTASKFVENSESINDKQNKNAELQKSSEVAKNKLTDEACNNDEFSSSNLLIGRTESLVEKESRSCEAENVTHNAAKNDNASEKSFSTKDTDGNTSSDDSCAVKSGSMKNNRKNTKLKALSLDVTDENDDKDEDLQLDSDTKDKKTPGDDDAVVTDKKSCLESANSHKIGTNTMDTTGNTDTADEKYVLDSQVTECSYENKSEEGSTVAECVVENTDHSANSTLLNNENQISLLNDEKQDKKTLKAMQSENSTVEKADELNKIIDNEAQFKPTIRCVKISSLLENKSEEQSPIGSPIKKGVKEKKIHRIRKVVTFLDKPIEICSSPEKVTVSHTKNRPSILLNETPSPRISALESSSKTKDDSSESDSDVSSATKKLLKFIKSNILDGKCKAVVDVIIEPLSSWSCPKSLDRHGITKVYNVQGEISYDKSKMVEIELNENAKRAVLNSTSSSGGSGDDSSNGHATKRKKSKNASDSSLTNENAKRAVLNSTSSSDGSGDDSSNGHATKRKKSRNASDSSSANSVRNTSFPKKKKFTKKRHKRSELSDSEAEIENLVSIPKHRKDKSRRESNSGSEDEPHLAERNNDSDEMGRSLRLKGRSEQAATSQQSKKDRSDSDASTTSVGKGAPLKKSGDNTLLNALINGDTKDKSTSELEHSSESGVESKSKSKGIFSGKPMDRIKNDLLDDTSSSARESSPKLNGRDKKGKHENKNKKVDSDEEKDLKTEKDQDSDSSASEKIKSKSGSVIELDTDSDNNSRRKPKKEKKSAQNGKNSNSEDDAAEDNEEEKGDDSESDDSEIFVPSRRKRKPKAKSSGESSDDSKTGKSKKKMRRIKKISGDESSGGSDDGSGSDGDNTKKGRKNIRALKKSSNLDSATRIAARKEKERVARIAERQKLYNESLFDESCKPDEVIKLDKVILDFDPETKEPSISVDKGLVEKLKPHQANGIKFMWDACFESEKQIKETKGSGCILAHCMGLGKTLQVVTLVHTLLTHKEQTKVERVLVVCPLSTVLNWVNEFKMWLEHAHSEEEINIFELSRFKQNYERSFQLKEWLEYGGVCILGYDMFRNLSADNAKKYRKAQLNTFQKALVDPGPHLVVCDEGHLLKNEKTSISQSMNRIKSLRRIVLTGTPLQNNLKEYYCMVQFVKPDLLGKYNEYLNRFVNPITNGQYTNSTEHDIRIMKRRSHVLHKMLDGAVQRRDYAVLAPFLPPKHEYVLFISLTDIQVKLYAHYLENYSRRPNPDRKTTPSLFADFQSLQRIWTHPLVLKANSERYELMQQKKRDKEEDDDSEGSLADFIDDEEETTTPQDTSLSESEDSDSDNKKSKNKKKGKSSKVKHKRVTRANPVKMEEDDEVVAVETEQQRSDNPTEWWMSLCSEEELNDVRHSNKLLLLLDILKMCDAIGDKLLVFSQSLYSLDLIEQFLAKIDDATQKSDTATEEHLGGHVGSWSQGLDYFRLDGSTSCENREIWCKAFNREDNPRARLFLISTRAGGLGINLVAANRVVIFDMSWNPSHDVQSIFRVYRFGQKKPCYIYRFLALGTMEEKIYERQVTKQAISKRVIDEQQIDRHYTESDLAELYIFCPVPEGTREVPKLPKDRLFADLLQQHDKVIYKFHEHDSLLENKEEETLTEEERKAAWEDYENEKTRPPPTLGGSNWLQGLQQQHQQQQMTMNALSAVLRQDYPSLTEQQIATMIPAILQQMYTNGDAALMQKMTAMMTAQNMMGAYKYPANNMMGQGMMGMNPGAMGVSGAGMRAPMYQQSWQQQQQMQLQRLQQQQAMQANLKYYAGGLGSRDMMDMAALQQQQRAMLMGAGGGGGVPQRGRPPKGPPKQSQEVVELDSE